MKPIPDAPAGTPTGESAAAAPAPAPGNGAAQPAGDTQAGGQPAKAAEPSPSTVPDPEELTPYTDEELKTAYRSLPEAIRKANQKIFSETKMKLADAGRLGEALLKDPVGFAKQLVEKVGRERVLGTGPVAGEPATSKETAKAITDELAPFFAGDVNSAKAFEGILTRAIDNSIAPFREAHVRAVEQALVAENQSVLAQFLKDNPDAQQYEGQMGEFFEKFPPGENVSARDALEAAYSYASRNARVAASASAAVERLTTSAQAQAGNGTAPAGGAPIAPTAPRQFPSVAEAAAAALRGERWS